MSARRLAVRAGLGLLAVTGGLLATGIGGLLLLSTDAGNDLTLAVALPRLQRYVPRGTLEIERLRFNLISELTLSGVALRDAEGRLLVGFDALRLRYDLGGIFDRRLGLTVALQRPVADLRVGADGRLDLLDALGIPPSPPEQAPSEPWAGLPGRVDLGAIEITDADIRYVDGETELHLSELALGASGTVHGRVARLEGLDGQGRLLAPGGLPIAIQGDLGLLDGTAVLDELALTLGGSRVLLDGAAKAVETRPELDLRAELALRPADLDLLLGASEPLLVSSVEARLGLQGPLSGLRGQLDLGGAPGVARLDAWADLEATPLAWKLALDTEGYELGALLAAVSERTRLAGHTEIEGTGTRWPAAPGETGEDLLRGTVRMAGAEQVFWGEPVRDLRLDASVDAGKLEIRRLSGRHAVAGVSARGSVDVPAGRAELQTQLSAPDLGLLRRYGLEGAGGAARYQGRLRADWSGERARVDAEGTLRGEAIRLPGQLGVASLEAPLEAHLDGGALVASGSLDLGGVEVPGGAVARASLGFSATRAESGALSAQLSRLAVREAASADGRAGVGLIEGEATLSMDARGALGGRWDLVVTELRLPTGVSGGGPLSGALAHDRLTVSADLRGEEQPLLVAEARGDLAGGSWAISGLALGITPGTTLRGTEELRFTLTEDGARDVHAALESEAGALSVDGAIGASEVDARLELAKLDLGWVSRLSGQLSPEAPPLGLSGHVDADLALRARPDTAPEGRIKLAILDAQLEGTTAAPLDLGLVAALGGERLRLDGSVTREGRPWIALGGELPVALRPLAGEARLQCGEELAARALVGPISARELATVLPEADQAFEQAALDLTLRGDACDPEIALDLSGSLRDEDLGRTLRADLDLARAGADLRVSGGVEVDLARRLQLDGRATTGLSEVLAWLARGAPQPDLGAPSTWVSNLELNAVPLAIPLEVLGAPDTLGGALTGGVQLSGGIEDLSLAGGLQWTGARIGAVDLNLGYLGLVPEGDGYALTTLLGFTDGGGLAIEGFVPFSLDLAGDLGAGLDAALADERLALRVSDGQGGHARVPLAVLTGAAEGLSEPVGDLELWGEITGALASPAPDLQLRATGAGLTVDSTRVRYEDLSLDAELRQDRVLVRSLKMASLPRYGAAARKGGLALDGAIALEDYGLGAISLDATLDEFTASATEDMTISASGALTARGPWPDLRLAGDLALGNTRIVRTKDDFLSSTSLALSPDIAIFRDGQQVHARGAGARPPVYERFQLDLNVDLQRNLRLKVELPTQGDYGEQFAALSSVNLDASFDGEIAVDGTVGAPSLRGTIETGQDGRVDLLNASFELESGGAISFVGGDYDNPILDLRAVRRTAEYGDVNVDISQDVEHIKVDFSADQFPDPSDALSLVVFGMPTSELTDKEGGMGMQLWALARSGLSGQVERAVGLSALDEFEIDPSSGAVRVGKALSDRLFLSVEQRFSVENEADNLTEATVEWLILRQLYADFVTGDAGQSSADIYWRWRF